ncbi:substrate-binding domain-containing protein [Sulfurimonas marina]|uniref:Substrate-binding domain-containing protein n=1 Tax=Sulfurimonas marina TaxID=2590551 RepID=A0A7M1AUQ1_9BACT|nr:substrate-binding domain-containing protein [Sulfurimonas marina]QOP41155.1 substrate-binding domain-containing protein [Sulfurimonas marina]
MHIVRYLIILVIVSALNANEPQTKKIAYLVSDLKIPFWDIMRKGIVSEAKTLHYDLQVYNADNSLEKELKNTVKAIRNKVDGIIVSPINSSSCVTILKLAQRANIPVVISDIGTDKGEYVSYVSSNNYQGAYAIAKVLAKHMKMLGWEKGTVGIVAIPQKRSNGKARTAGFLQGLHENNIKSSSLKQQVDFSYKETYDYTMEMIESDPNLRAVWLQGSDKYQGALDAIKDARKSGEILLVTFDAEPIFLELIPQGIVTGSAMQQPFLMGEKATALLDRHLKGKVVKKSIELPVLAISKENIDEKLPLIKRNVLGLNLDAR